MKHLLRPWQCAALLVLAGGLAACDPAPPQPQAANTPPSAAPGSAAGMGAAPAASTAAVQGLGADAATVAASAEPAAQSGPPPLSNATASPLGALRGLVGTYPSDSNVSFLEQGVLAERLKQLLGKDYATLLATLRTVSPLEEDAGRWYIRGNRPHEGGTEAAAVVVDASQNAVRVWMLHEGRVTEYQDPPHVNVPWPADIAALQSASRGSVNH